MVEDDKGAKRPLGREPGLGWLASSGVQPKKRKEIHGVSAASLVALKAELAVAQQEVAAVREGRVDPQELRERRRGPLSLSERRNTGVAERDARDRAGLRTDQQRLDDSRVALERKAELYERLARGEAVDQQEGIADRYEVDFLLKHPLDTAGLLAGGRGGGLVSADMARERARRDWEQEVEGNLAREEAAAARREEHRQVMEEVVLEAEADRRRAAAEKQARTEAEARKRERLKATFMQKQLAAAKQAAAAAKQQRQRQQPAAMRQQQQQQAAGEGG